MLVNEFLERSADRLSSKVALICDGQRLTYEGLDSRANRLANALLERDLHRGDRVVIWLPNTIELVVSIFAILKAGGVFVTMNPTAKADKVAYVVQNCEASALITSEGHAKIAATMVNDLDSLRIAILTGSLSGEDLFGDSSSFDDIQRTYHDDRPLNVNIDLDLACLIYTSGSTGEPKGVMSDHSNVDFATSSIISYIENVEDDIVINVLPLAFDYGLYQLLMTIKFGGTLVLERSFAYPAAVLKRIQDEHVTGFPGVPTMFAVLLKMDLEHFDLSSLSYITNTAAALPPSHIQELRSRFPDVRLYSMYGLTETKRTLYLPPEQLDIRPDSVGLAIPGTEVWIEGENGGRLGPDQIGELVIRGRHVMRGYWGDEKATAERFRPGLLPHERVCYSGDLFRMDEEGFLYFVSRKDDIIKTRGEKVAPKEIENILYQLPEVVEAAVIGIDDPVLGEALKALIVTADESLSERRVLEYCRNNLEDFMVPKYIEFCKALPKSESGKIIKKGWAEGDKKRPMAR
jgi:long-chain acyl-CoA synthetase